jgi:Ca2+-binding EF-hand superfamily protein
MIQDVDELKDGYLDFEGFKKMMTSMVKEACVHQMK